MKENRHYLTTFDLNQDGHVSEAEGEHAFEAIMDWALEMQNSRSRWYYVEGTQAAGPVLRDQLLSIVEKAPGTYISFGEDNLWIPYRAIQLACA